MTKINTCISLGFSTILEFEQSLNLIETPDFVEIRADYLDSSELENVFALKPKIQQPAIFTARMKRNGGNLDIDSEFWKSLVLKACKSGFEYIDLDFAEILKDKSILYEVRKSFPKVQVIISHHDFAKTPCYRELRKLQRRMRGFSPDIVKIATESKSQKDNENLYRLTTNKLLSEKMIVLGMGEVGKMTRLLCPLLGSFLTFVSLPNKATASGQMTLEEVQKFASGINRL